MAVWGRGHGGPLAFRICTQVVVMCVYLGTVCVCGLTSFIFVGMICMRCTVILDLDIRTCVAMYVVQVHFL